MTFLQLCAPAPRLCAHRSFRGSLGDVGRVGLSCNNSVVGCGVWDGAGAWARARALNRFRPLGGFEESWVVAGVSGLQGCRAPPFWGGSVIVGVWKARSRWPSLSSGATGPRQGPGHHLRRCPQRRRSGLLSGGRIRISKQVCFRYQKGMKCAGRREKARNRNRNRHRKHRGKPGSKEPEYCILCILPSPSYEHCDCKWGRLCRLPPPLPRLFKPGKLALKSIMLSRGIAAHTQRIPSILVIRALKGKGGAGPRSWVGTESPSYSHELDSKSCFDA